MDFFDVNQTDIKNQIYEKVRTNLNTKGITNFNPGGVMRGFIEITAYFVYLIYQVLNKTFKNAFAKTAEGQWLDAKCLDVGIERKKAQQTSIYITFGRNEIKDSAVKIKAGSIIKTKMNYEGKEYFFQTLNESVLSNNSKEIAVLCQSLETGSYNNLISNTPVVMVTNISGLDYVSVGEAQITVFGTDDETDDELRERYFLAWKGLNSGGKDYYRGIAAAIDGVSTVTVYPISRGSGTLDIVITSTGGIPSDELINQVQTEIDNNLQFDGIDVLVTKPTIVDVSLNLNVSVYFLIEQSDAFVISIKDVVNDYCSKFIVGQDLIISQLQKYLLTEFTNIKDISSSIGNVTATGIEWLNVSIGTVTLSIDGEV